MTALVESDVARASAKQWEQLFELHRHAVRIDSPDDPPADLVVWEKSIEATARDPQTDYRTYLAVRDDQVVGRFTLTTPTVKYPHYDTSKHVAFAHFLALPTARRQGVGRGLMQRALAECQQRRITLLQGESKSESGNAFAENFGGSIGSLVRENRLALGTVDWSLVERWAAEGRAKNPDVEIETFEGLISDCDGEIARYARLYAKIENQTSAAELEGTDVSLSVESLRLEDREHRNMGMQLWTKVGRFPDGALCGLTEINYHPARQARVVQGITGVRERYRGKGLGKLLKADMLLFIRGQFPAAEYVGTTNANSNAPMQAINERLGFKFYNQRTVYKLNLEDVAIKLASW